MQVILKVAQKTEGVLAVAREIKDEHGETKPDINAVTEFYQCSCSDGITFRQTHWSMLQKLERQLLSFPASIRRELLVWFTDKHSRGNLLIEIEDGSLGFLGGLCNNEILGVHFDYGELTYPESSRCCRCHGVHD